MPAPNLNRESAANLDGVLDELERCSRGAGKVSVGDIHQAVGQRAYGPLLLVPAIGAMTPIGVIPGAPTLLALCVLLIALQLAAGRERPWLPGWLEKLSVRKERVAKAVKIARPVARVVDKVVKPRLPALTRKPWVRLVGLLVAVLALAVPPMELVPFAVFAPAAAIAAVGLGLTARDGVATIVALVLSGATLAVGVRALV